MKKTLKIVTTALTAFFFLSSIMLLVMGTMAIQENKYVKIFNHSYSVVGSGSMEPTIMTGEFIIIKYVSYDKIYAQVEAGKKPIIAFRTDKNIVHRAIATDGDKIITKGDHNPSEDATRVEASNYIGVVVSHFMLLDVGKITLNYKSVVFLFIIGILLFILIHEFLNIVKIIRHRSEEKLLDQHEKEKAKWIEEEKERIREELELEMKTKNKSKSDPK